MKYFIAALSTIATMSSAALATERYRCEGEIGNGCRMTDACYEVHGTRTHAFALDCPRVRGTCTYMLNANGGEGILSNDFVSLYGDLDMGHFIPSTGFLSFKISEGDSYSQRWFNGICTRVD